MRRLVQAPAITMTLLVLLLVFSCKKEEPEEEIEPFSLSPTVTVYDPEIFTCKVDGKHVEFNDHDGALVNPTTWDLEEIDAEKTIVAEGALIFSTSDDAMGGFCLGTLTHYDGVSTKTDYDELFSKGGKNFTELGGEGVVMFYTTEDSTVYRSDWGSANQSGSTFEITAVKDSRWLGWPALKVLAEFNCKVYNEEGDQLDLTEGILLLEVITYVRE